MNRAKKFPFTSEIMKPIDIDLSGDFDSQLDNLLRAVRLSQDELESLNGLYQDIATALRRQWPGCAVIPFGSITTGLGLKGSDADCYIHIPPEENQTHGSLVNRAKRILKMEPKTFTGVISIPRANTPIVKFVHVPTAYSCDITFKTSLGMMNSKLISFLLQSDPRLTPLAVVVKYWARVNGFSGRGKISNYALTMLLIFYLQQPPVSILPSVEFLQKDPKTEIIVDEWNAGFSDDNDRLPKSENMSSISELLGGFFHYYSTFNFAENIVCPFLGIPVSKYITVIPPAFNRYLDNVTNRGIAPLKYNTAICIQDPFNHAHNVASMITDNRCAEIIALFKFAAAAYETEKLNGCNKLLQTILSEKPLIPDVKLEYRGVIAPRVVRKVENPDWMSVMREVTVKIFEQICKIKMDKIEKKPDASSIRPKDKYMCVLTRAIWKRKQFSRINNRMKPEFLEKQTLITEEILKVEHEIYNIQFQLTLVFKPERKHTTIMVKLIVGDSEAFREFGKFFRSDIIIWYYILLRNYLQYDEDPNEKFNPFFSEAYGFEVYHEAAESLSQKENCGASVEDDAQAAESSNID